MDDLFLIIVNVICAAILISYVLYKAHKKSLAAKAKASKKDDDFEHLLYTDEAE